MEFMAGLHEDMERSADRDVSRLRELEQQLADLKGLTVSNNIVTMAKTEAIQVLTEQIEQRKEIIRSQRAPFGRLEEEMEKLDKVFGKTKASSSTPRPVPVSASGPVMSHGNTVITRESR